MPSFQADINETPNPWNQCSSGPSVYYNSSLRVWVWGSLSSMTQVPRSSSVTDKCNSGMQTFTGEAVKGAGNLYAAQDWTEPCFLSVLLLLRQDKHSAVRGSNWIGSPSGEPTYRESSLHSRQIDHSRGRDAISALLKTALILSSETRVERCTPSVLFLSPFPFEPFYFLPSFFLYECANFPYASLQLPVIYWL